MVKKKEMLIDGVLLVDKPANWTSHDVCAFVRNRFRIPKVGHAGTLDPMATGLLVLLLGKATKSQNLLMAADKVYEGIMQLGLETDSHDKMGKTVCEAPFDGITLEQIREKTKAFTGNIVQVPPMVSALKHQGVRLYKLARKGHEIPREGREVVVHHFEILAKDGAFVKFNACVSKGTYVRTLIHDLGHSLNTCATLYELRRVRSGNLEVSASLTIEALKTMEPVQLYDRVLSIQSLSDHAYSR